MHMIDGPRTVPALPAARAPGAAGYFGPGVPASGQKATALTYEFMNALMMEVINPILQAGLTLDRNDHTQLYQAIVQIASDIAGGEVGKVEYFVCKAPPARYLKCDGRTIGSAGSGATARAHADTLPLYSLLWADWENFVLPIQDSAGVAAVRGASAAADFAAGKRLPLPELRGEHIRVWDDGRGVDSGRVFGSFQADEIRLHGHPFRLGSGNNNTDPVGGLAMDEQGAQTNYPGYTGELSGTQGQQIGGIGGTETRGRNVALSAFIRFK